MPCAGGVVSELVAFGVPRGAKRPMAGRFAPAEFGIAHWLARQRGLGLLAAAW